MQEHETIGLSAGTTTTLVARELQHRPEIHIITNAVNIGMELSSSTGLKTTLTGGAMLWVGAFSLVGPAAIETLGMFVNGSALPERDGHGPGARRDDD